MESNLKRIRIILFYDYLTIVNRIQILTSIEGLKDLTFTREGWMASSLAGKLSCLATGVCTAAIPESGEKHWQEHLIGEEEMSD